MYENVGGKLKGLAVASMIVGILLSICIGGLFFYDEDTIAIGIIVVIAGFLISWISSLALYGFGQLVDNSDNIANRLNNINCSVEICPTDDTIEAEDIIECIKSEKERIAKLLKLGKIGQAEYDKSLMKLCDEEEKMKKVVVNETKTFDQILSESDLTSEQKTKLKDLKALKDDGYITQNDCKNRMTAVLQDVPLDLLMLILKKI